MTSSFWRCCGFCRRRSPHVLLVYGGGPNTLKNVELALQRGQSAILVQKSGRAADALDGWLKATTGEWAELEDHADSKDSEDGLLELKKKKLKYLFNENDLKTLTRAPESETSLIKQLDAIWYVSLALPLLPRWH